MRHPRNTDYNLRGYPDRLDALRAMISWALAHTMGQNGTKVPGLPGKAGLHHACFAQPGFCAASNGPYTNTKPPKAATHARPANSTSVMDPLKAATILAIAAARTAA